MKTCRRRGETFHRWIGAQGVRPAEDVWERYLTGPETGSDPGGWRTELIQPLAD